MLQTPLELRLHVSSRSAGRRMEVPFARRNIPPRHLRRVNAKPHLRHQKSHREPQLSGIGFVWVFLLANEAVCGWLRPTDDRFVTYIEAPGPPLLLLPTSIDSV